MKIIHNDCVATMKEMPENFIDSIITDPPYGISFMGKKWDYDVPSEEVWRECLRVLKPGGHLLAFAGTRTQHRMAVRIEDAGFEIRDMIAWVYGSGFPKSHNLKGDWQGWGTALKPALEPITVARKPFHGTVAANALKYGTGAINVDGCRVAIDPSVDDPRLGGKGAWKTNKAAQNIYEGGYAGNEITSSALGRWPANLIHDGSDDVVGLFPESNGGASPKKSNIPPGKHYEGGWGCVQNEERIEYGNGSAARFFYCAKASKKDRDDGNGHPTVKPTDLMRYLCRLVTPPHGIVLDPFMGSGSTGKAATLEGFDFIGIEKDGEYIKIAKSRISKVIAEKQYNLL
jgi:site-specific DNA-methyltransferase (adenine-specific)